MDTRGRGGSDGESNPWFSGDHAFTIYSKDLRAASPSKERRTQSSGDIA